MVSKSLFRPITSEKSTKLKSLGVYLFEIAKEYNKNSIASAIEKLYSVKVGDVRIFNRVGKVKVRRNGKKVVFQDKKYAYVKLRQGVLDMSLNKI